MDRTNGIFSGVANFNLHCDTASNGRHRSRNPWMVPSAVRTNCASGAKASDITTDQKRLYRDLWEAPPLCDDLGLCLVAELKDVDRRGCSNPKFNPAPSCVLRLGEPEWVFHHEVGHLLGLPGHQTSDGNQPPGNLMRCDRAEAAPPLLELDEPQKRLLAEMHGPNGPNC